LITKSSCRVTCRGSVILAVIILKLSLYGIFRLILPILPVASLYLTPLTYVICVITIIYASLNTFRTVDIKELIAYSSVAHAAVYILEVFSTTIQGIEGAIFLGLGHGFVSLGLFICVGAVLYDRTHSRLITYYRGVAQRACGLRPAVLKRSFWAPYSLKKLIF